MSFQNPYQNPSSHRPDDGYRQDSSMYPSLPGDSYDDQVYHGYQDTSFVPPRSDAFREPGHPEPTTGEVPIMREKRGFVSRICVILRILMCLADHLEQ